MLYYFGEIILINILKSQLQIFDEYPVENFHSLVQRHTSEKVIAGE